MDSTIVSALDFRGDQREVMKTGGTASFSTHIMQSEAVLPGADLQTCTSTKLYFQFTAVEKFDDRVTVHSDYVPALGDGRPGFPTTSNR